MAALHEHDLGQMVIEHPYQRINLIFELIVHLAPHKALAVGK